MNDYQTYATTLVKDILPSERLKNMINFFMTDAGINMGSEFTDKTLERVIEIVQNQFRFLPLCYIYSAFRKGSLGHYGPGRLVPRTIYGWLNEISLEYNRYQDHVTNQSQNFSDAADLKKFPAGTAICLKIDWIQSGLITNDDWDRIPMKDLAGLIAREQYPTTKDFGL